MNKQEFVELISRKTQISKSKCDQFLNEFKAIILDVCAKGESVAIRNFGKFSMEQKPARKFLNPQTKRFYVCQSKKIVAFKGFKNFKNALK